MHVIKLQLPSYAADLIRRKTPQQVFDDMVKNNGIPFQEMTTFGMVLTPIINNETGAEHAYVIYWHNGQASVHRYTSGDEFLPLVGVEEWGKDHPNYEEALEIYYRLFRATHVKEILWKSKYGWD